MFETIRSFLDGDGRVGRLLITLMLCEEKVLVGVSVTARAATSTAHGIVALREEHRGAVSKSAKALKLLDGLFRKPIVSAKRITEIVGCTHPTAVKLARNVEARGWLTESTGYERNRVYRYLPYLDLFHREVIEARQAGGAEP